MHGIIFNQLYRFVVENHNYETLINLKTKAGLSGSFHDATKSYPDEEMQRLINAAVEMLGVDRDAVLEAFGSYIAPGLLKIYGAYIPSNWKSMDLLAQIEETIHRVVKMNQPEADPPKLIVNRVHPNEVHIEYNSPRKMIALGIGIIKKIGEHFQENLSIEKEELPEGSLLKIRLLDN